MNNLINNAIIPVINDRGMSSLRMNHLIYIKEFIDRISGSSYLNHDELDRLNSRFGAVPDVITWGDYFQAELATSMQWKSDEEFIRAFDTVKFDMISSWLIFKDKGSDFFEWIENSFSGIETGDTGVMGDEDREIIHLKILMDYYREMGIAGRFTESELSWHSSFSEALAI